MTSHLPQSGGLIPNTHVDTFYMPIRLKNFKKLDNFSTLFTLFLVT